MCVCIRTVYILVRVSMCVCVCVHVCMCPCVCSALFPIQLQFELYNLLFSYVLNLELPSLIIIYTDISKLFFGPLKCCGRTFSNMGALASHERHKHGVLRPDRDIKSTRKSYPLRMKSAVLASAELLLAVRCQQCGNTTTSGERVGMNRVELDENEEDGWSWEIDKEWEKVESEAEENEELEKWGIEPVEGGGRKVDHGGKGLGPMICACGCNEFKQELRFKYQVADMFGIHKSVLSRWQKKRATFLALMKDKPGLRKLVRTVTCTHACHVH